MNADTKGIIAKWVGIVCFIVAAAGIVWVIVK